MLYTIQPVIRSPRVSAAMLCAVELVARLSHRWHLCDNFFLIMPVSNPGIYSPLYRTLQSSSHHTHKILLLFIDQKWTSFFVVFMNEKMYRNSQRKGIDLFVMQ